MRVSISEPLRTNGFEKPAPDSRAHPCPSRELDRQPCRASRQPLRADQHARRLAPFDHPLQPQPRRERQPPDGVGRRLGDIEDDEAEVARLQDERQRFNRLLERALIEIAAHARARDDVAANPEQPGEIEAGRGRRRHVEAIERVDQRDELAARVAAAIIRSSRLVRPDDRGPTSSDNWPRGNPPPSRASSGGRPVADTTSSSSPVDATGGAPR